MSARLRLIGFALAVIAYVATLALPMYSTRAASTSGDGAATATEGTATLIAINGWTAAIPGLLLVAFAFGVWRSPHLMVRWICLGLFLVIAALGLLSIGLFFLPAALLLILGTSLDRGEPDPA